MAYPKRVNQRGHVIRPLVCGTVPHLLLNANDNLSSLVLSARQPLVGKPGRVEDYDGADVGFQLPLLKEFRQRLQTGRRDLDDEKRKLHL